MLDNFLGLDYNPFHCIVSSSAVERIGKHNMFSRLKQRGKEQGTRIQSGVETTGGHDGKGTRINLEKG
ncbi:MAG: hypothetical protein ACM3MD_05745 [Betaproteobacteria bacterium]